MLASIVIAMARRSAGLSQRELARRAGTSQPAIAAYEGGSRQPTVSTLNRLLDACGLRLTWQLSPVDNTLSETVWAIANAVAVDDTAAALRLAVEFYDRSRRAPDDELEAVIGPDPGSTGDVRWDALLAGLVERLANGREMGVPHWTIDSRRFLTTWWFISPYRSLHASALVGAPPELANRGVFIHASSLESV